MSFEILSQEGFAEYIVQSKKATLNIILIIIRKYCFILVIIEGYFFLR